MTKYQQYFQDMMEYHKELMSDFKKVHDNFALDPEKWRDEFNEKGQEVLPIIRRCENNLCGKSESGKYGKFSSKLADKFWELIRKQFPKIDLIGSF